MVQPIDHSSLFSRPLNSAFINNQLNINQTLERLSKGLRVNRAADDPSSITYLTNNQSMLLSNRQAIGNSQDLSLMTTTALDNTRTILSQLQRMREIALQSLNTSTTDQERLGLQKELTSLSTEIDRIARSTEFNGRYLLDGSTSAFQAGQASTYKLLNNQSITDPVSSLASNFINSLDLDGEANTNAVFEFRLFNAPGKGYTSLEISSSNQNIIANYDYFLDAPSNFSLSLSGTGGPYLNIQRNDYQEPARTPLSAAELASPLQGLANLGRIDQVTYGNLALTAGGQVFSNVINVTASTSIDDVLTAINNLSSANNTFNATYDTTTGKITVGYTTSKQAESVSNTSYTPAVPGAAGGPFDAFALITPPSQGPAYRDLDSYLPTAGFAVSSPPVGFPTLPGNLSANLDYTGTSASFLNTFGLNNLSGAGTVTGYNTSYYGETIATGGLSEYVNRTRVTIDDITAQQSQSGSITGLNDTTDLDETFRVLNTSVINASNFGAGDFTIDFGDNGLFTFTGFDPNVHGIDEIEDAINAFKPGLVSASFDEGSDRLSITNTVNPTDTNSKVNDPGLGSGGAFTIDFGSNGTFNYDLQLGSSTIQDFVNALNAHSGVTASFDASTDSLNIDNTVSPTYGTQVSQSINPGTFQIDFGDGRIFSLSNPQDYTIEGFVSALNGFAGVSANFDPNSDQLTITNTPVNGTQNFYDTKIDGSALSTGTFNIDFGTNGTFYYNNGNPFNGGDQTIQGFINAINAFGSTVGNRVTANYDAANDRIVINNISEDQSTSVVTDIGYKLSDPGIGNSALQIDFGDNGIFTSSQALRNYTLDGIAAEISAFNANVSASYNSGSDSLNIINTAPDIPGKLDNIAVAGVRIHFQGDSLGGNVGHEYLDLGNLQGKSINEIVNAIEGNQITFNTNTGSFTITLHANFNLSDDKLSITTEYTGGNTNVNVIFDIEDYGGSGNFTDLFNMVGSPVFDVNGSLYRSDSSSSVGNIDSADLNTPLSSLTAGSSGNNQIIFLSPGAKALFNIGDAFDNNTNPNSSGDDTNTITGGNIDNDGLNALLDIDSTDASSRTIAQLMSTLVQQTTTATTPGNNQITFNDNGTGLAATLQLTTATNTGTGLRQVLGGDLDKGYLDSDLNLDDSGDLNKSLNTLATENILINTISITGSNQISILDNGTGIAGFFNLVSASNTGAGTAQSISSAGDIDNSNSSALLDISGNAASTDYQTKTLATLANAPILIAGTDNNSITFSAGLGERVRDFFKLSNRPDNSPTTTGTYTQTTGSLPGGIDNGPNGSPYDITALDVTSASFADLINTFSTGPNNNQIVFGGANGTNIRNVFKLSDVASSNLVGEYKTNLNISALGGIDNGALDSSLELDATEVDNNSLSELLTPRLGTLVSGPLILDGNTIINIDPDADTINAVLGAINAYTLVTPTAENKRYSASFSGGQLNITVTDTESLAPSGSTLPANPGEATPRINGNEFVYDSAAYIAQDAPQSVNGTPLNPSGTGPAEQSFSSTPLDSRYLVTAPAAPADISSLSFGGSSNLASVLYLNAVPSGSDTGPNIILDEYQGIITATGTNSYNLEATRRQTFEASSSSTSTEVIGRNRVKLNQEELGVVAQIQTFSEETGSDDNRLYFQIGAQEGDTTSAAYADLTSEKLRIESLQLLGNDSSQTRQQSLNVLNTVEQAIKKTESQMRRFEHLQFSTDSELDNLNAKQEYISGAYDARQQIDLPTEIKNLSRSQLVAQAGSFALSQELQNTKSLYNVLFDSLPGLDENKSPDSQSPAGPSSNSQLSELKDQIEQAIATQLTRVQEQYDFEADLGIVSEGLV